MANLFKQLARLNEGGHSNYLGPGALATLAAVADLQRRGKVTTRTICALRGVSVNAVQQALVRLRRAGLVTQESPRPGKRSCGGAGTIRARFAFIPADELGHNQGD